MCYNRKHVHRTRGVNFQEIKGYIENGFLPANTLALLQAGAISKEWIKRNLTQNRDFILSKLSAPVQILINTGQMPSDIEEAIFSGKYNKSEIQRMMLENDDVVKMMLPKKLSDMLEVRFNFNNLLTRTITKL